MNDLRRLTLATILFVIGMMLWNGWIAEHPQHFSPTATNISTLSNNTSTSTIGATTTLSTPTLPLTQRYITVTTPLVEATIDRMGGNLTSVKLLAYPVSLHQTQPIQLLNTDPATFYVAHSGFKGDALPSNTQMIFKSDQLHYQLDKSHQPLRVKLTWHNAKGLNITKTYTFAADNYLILVSHQLNNQTQNTWNGQFFAELQRKPVNPGGMGPFHFNTYLGGAISSPEKRYEKISFKEMQEKNLDSTTSDGWLAMIQHYFLSAWVPNPTENFHYYSHANDNDIYTLGLTSAPINIAPNQQYITSAKLYVGPELADQLAKIAPGLKLTVDYGILWFIAVIIFWWMKKLYLITGNWGWAIVLVTLTIKLLFYKLNATSFRSMAAMRALQPKLQQVRERFGEDRQKMAQATMELYKREKINPLGGCLPLIVQIPVFLALYWVLVESVELRQAPFILWIHDLSAKDPYYILPLLMGLTIFIQQWLAPITDPVQRKVMLAMPIVFTGLFLSFPAGLVLYWVVNNSLSILQQWYIMKYVVSQPADTASAKKKLKHEQKS